MCEGEGMVPSWITLIQPETNGIPWQLGTADSSTLLLHSCQQILLIIQTAKNYSSPINVSNILYQVSVHKTFNTNMSENANS